MSEFKGTQGRWVVYRGPMNMNGGLNPFFKGIVALVKNSGEDDDIAVITDTDRPAFEYIENAHALAAAPELLAACIAMDEADDDFALAVALEGCRAAIAKALGGDV